MNCYFETLSDAVDAAMDRGLADRCVFTRPTDIWALCQDPLPYGAVRSADIQLDFYRGKPTRKYYHVVITRLDSGRYELVNYVL